MVEHLFLIAIVGTVGYLLFIVIVSEVKYMGQHRKYTQVINRPLYPVTRVNRLSHLCFSRNIPTEMLHQDFIYL